LKQIKRRPIAFEQTNAGVERGDGDAFAAQLQRSRKALAGFDAFQKGRGV
jgi:hypothetical protein